MYKRYKKPLLSIIIPAFNTKEFYKPCLTSLLKIKYPNFEIIIVDDGSTDGSFEAIKKMSIKDKRIKIIKTLKRRGIPGSRNLGIEAANGDLIAFFDMDMEVTNTWPNELIKVLMRSPKIGGVLPKVFDFKKRHIFQSVGGRIIPQTGGPIVRGIGQKDEGQFDEEKEISVNAAGVIMRTEVVRALEGYDETLGMYDDIDFGWRMWIYGWKSYYVPSAYIYHYTAKTWEERPGASRFEHEYYLDNVMRTIIKNFETKNVIKYLPQAILITMVRIVINLLRGNFITLQGATKAFYVNLIRLPQTLSERKKIQQNRKFSDKFLMGKVFMEGSYPYLYKKYISPSLELGKNWKSL
jgi:GT2 family glycosyltransferase